MTQQFVIIAGPSAHIANGQHVRPVFANRQARNDSKLRDIGRQQIERMTGANQFDSRRLCQMNEVRNEMPALFCKRGRLHNNRDLFEPLFNCGYMWEARIGSQDGQNR